MTNWKHVTDALPAVSPLGDGLYIGSWPDDEHKKVPDYIKSVIRCCPARRPYSIGPNQQRYHGYLFDVPEEPHNDALLPLFLAAKNCWDAGPTLVHCKAGLNRSGLICALLLVDRGIEPAKAIAHLREHRSPYVLSNPVFENFVLRQVPLNVLTMTLHGQVFKNPPNPPKLFLTGED